MSSKHDDIIKSLLASTGELGPLTPPAMGTLLLSKRKYRTPAEVLLQERNGIWFIRDLAAPDWQPQEYYISWRMIWKKYFPLHTVRVADAPINDLEELLEIISWVPASDI